MLDAKRIHPVLDQHGVHDAQAKESAVTKDERSFHRLMERHLDVPQTLLGEPRARRKALRAGLFRFEGLALHAHWAGSKLVVSDAGHVTSVFLDDEAHAAALLAAFGRAGLVRQPARSRREEACSAAWLTTSQQ